MPVLRRHLLLLGLLVLATLALGAAGCTEREAANERPIIPEATPTALAALGGDFQQLLIRVVDGEFQDDVYSVQEQDRIRLLVQTQGGPYTMEIGDLMGPTQIAANDVTEVHLTTPQAGEYPIQLSGPAEDTAVLNVRPIGGQ